MWRLILISLLALVNVVPTFPSLWGYDGEKLYPLHFDELNFPTSSSSPANMHADTRGDFLCVQRHGEGLQVRVCEDASGDFTWQSPPGWQVREVIFSDLNKDGIEELSLLVWRPFQPWPVDRFLPSGGRIASFHDEQGLSCHLILIGLVRGEIRELWAGSALADPLREILAADLDGDGYQELAALEYAYEGDTKKTSITVWSWNGFGFSLQARQAGQYSSLLYIPAGSGHVLIARQDL